MKRSLSVSLLSIVALFSAAQVHAGPCTGPSPFGDVAQNDIFCSDATWAKNAQIVAGCNATAVVLARAPGSSTTGELTDLHCQINVIARKL